MLRIIIIDDDDDDNGDGDRDDCGDDVVRAYCGPSFFFPFPLRFSQSKDDDLSLKLTRSNPTTQMDEPINH